jgi:glucose-1-phosphate cytidylyltransferase
MTTVTLCGGEGERLCDETVYNPELFDCLPDNPATMLEVGPLRRLAPEGKLGVSRHEGFWQPMGTCQEFALMNRLCAAGNALWTE